MLSATYTVSTTGSDSNSGTESEPFRTVGKAASVVVAGDSVHILAGEYFESVTNTTDGTAGSRIFYYGDGLDSSGHPKTIINYSDPLTNWVVAPEGSNGVYKCTVEKPILEMTMGAARQRVAWVYTDGDITAYLDNVYTNTPMVATGLEFLSMPTDTVLGNTYNKWMVWDTLGFLFTSGTTNTTCYFRGKNGEDPNTLGLRGMHNNGYLDNGNMWRRKAFYLSGSSYVTISNLWICGSPVGIYMDQDSHDNLVVSNYFTGMTAPIYLYGSALIGTNQIIGNTIFHNWCGWTNAGAYETSPPYPVLNAIKKHCYEYFKYLAGQNGNFSQGIYLYYAGNENVIAYNDISETRIQIDVDGNPTAPSLNTLIYSNTLYGSSLAGFISGPGQNGTRFFGNVVSDMNCMIRLAELDNQYETNRLLYIYRNTLWNPTNTGYHLYLFWAGVEGNTNFPAMWFYHNDFVGSYRSILANANAEEAGGAQQFRFVNNIFSGGSQFAGAYSAEFFTNGPPMMCGGFDYNLMRTNYVDEPGVYTTNIAWFGDENIQTGTDEWVTGSIIPLLTLSSGSMAANSALDVHSTFTFLGTEYPALPDTATKSGTAWDIGALEYTPPAATANTLRVGNMRSAP